MKNIFKKQMQAFENQTIFNINCDFAPLVDILSKYYDQDNFDKLSNSEKEKFLLEIINQNKEKLDITIKIKYLNHFQFIFQQTMTKIINFLIKINS